MSAISNLWMRFVRWYWLDTVRAERHRIECEARQFRGSVTWED